MNMKLFTVVLCAFALTASGQQKAAYTDIEAGKHAGEEATVTGKVVSITSKGTTYLNFGDRFPNQTFSAVLFTRNEANVGDVKQYEGKQVSVTGKIELSKDQKPQIVLTSSDQIRLAGASPAPMTAAPTATTPTPAPAGIPASELPFRKGAGKIALSSSWNGPSQGGELMRKDLAKLFGEVGAASETVDVDSSMDVYPSVPFLTSLEAAKKLIHLDGAPSVTTKIVTSGLPKSSFTAYTFSGVFPGGYNRLALITDTADQVVSVLVVDSGGRARITNEPDTGGYHTYNFITGKAKATNDLAIRHQIIPSTTPGVVIVDTMLVDPTDPDPQQPPTRSKSGSSKFPSSQKPKTGKIMERSRWFVPTPIVNLILRCVVR